MDRITLVTGGSRGIGAATARLCAAEGHAVAVNYCNDAEAAESVCAAVKAAGARAFPARADTGNEDDILAMFEAVDRELGPVTGLVNNAESMVRAVVLTRSAQETLRAFLMSTSPVTSFVRAGGR